jgi:hypothetical protein
VSVVRRICQSPIEESIIEDFAGFGTLNLFTLVQGKLNGNFEARV